MSFTWHQWLSLLLLCAVILPWIISINFIQFHSFVFNCICGPLEPHPHWSIYLIVWNDFCDVIIAKELLVYTWNWNLPTSTIRNEISTCGHLRYPWNLSQCVGLAKILIDVFGSRKFWSAAKTPIISSISPRWWTLCLQKNSRQRNMPFSSRIRIFQSTLWLCERFPTLMLPSDPTDNRSGNRNLWSSLKWCVLGVQQFYHLYSIINLGICLFSVPPWPGLYSRSAFTRGLHFSVWTGSQW